jgi:protein-L-isoaspartate(D-aspartate) O-methyltransferase
MDWLYLAPFCRTETVNQDAWQLNGRIGPLSARYILIVYADCIVTNAIHNEQVRDIMLQVDRADYCQHDPYSDFPQELGHNATISAPHMHAYALEHSLSVLTPGARRILDVGSGSGYLTTCYAELDAEYLVVGVDHIPELVEQALANTSRHHKDLLDSGRVRYVVGDGREGYPELAPYDVIHVGAAAAGRPARLLSQLKAGGVLIAPVGVRETEQQIVIYRKDDEGNVSEQATLSVRYVPLTDRKTQEQL